MSDRPKLWAAVALQLALLAAAPLTRLEALTEGRPITLVTVPVDPYDVLAGYYVTLRYQVERDATEMGSSEDGPVWLWLEPGTPGWRVQAVLREPADLPPTAVALAAEAENGRIRILDAGRMYIPENLQAEVETALREAEEPARVELRVGVDGQAVVRRLRVGDQVFGAPAEE